MARANYSSLQRLSIVLKQKITKNKKKIQAQKYEFSVSFVNKQTITKTTNENCFSRKTLFTIMVIAWNSYEASLRHIISLQIFIKNHCFAINKLAIFKDTFLFRIILLSIWAHLKKFTSLQSMIYACVDRLYCVLFYFICRFIKTITWAS